MDSLCKDCGVRCFQTEYHSTVCPMCGVEDFSGIYLPENSYCPYALPLIAPASYTRVKRFRKYLQRSARQQSVSTIPPVTWDYLFAGRPYSSPSAIVKRLKGAPRHVPKKCYDSLPMLVHTLCPDITVPCLNETEKYQAMTAFRTLDSSYNRGEPFVSYLYALEYILDLIGRSDMLHFINKIQCRKRRAAYRFRLDKIFKHTKRSGPPAARASCLRAPGSCSRSVASV